MIVRLLEKEALFFSTSSVLIPKSDPWREKVIHWFFSIVSALGGNQPVGVEHPFDRVTVHVSTALMDNYLASLSSERNARFRNDKVAYQVLATSCLMLGMRIVHQHQRNEFLRKQQEIGNEVPSSSGEMKRSSKLHQNMDQHARSNFINIADVFEIPNISSMLRISAASRSISEAHVLAMVREIASSRVFSRSRPVTALDFIQVFSKKANDLALTFNASTLQLEPSQERNASLLADAGLVCSRCQKPSVVACAAMTVAMLRSTPVENMTSVRQLVFRSIFGEHQNDESLQLVRDVEYHLLRATSRNGNHIPHRTRISSHVIPQEE
jgi:hypothetical protein